jgi:hypothetical protein
MRQTFSRFLLRGFSLAAGFVTVTSLVQAQVNILEVMYNPNNEAVWEWVEVRNDGATPINLDGYLAFNLGDNDLTAPNPTINSSVDPDTTINPGEIAVIYDGFYGSGNVNNYVDQRFRDAWGLGAGVKLIGADFWPEMVNTLGGQGKSIGFWANADDWRADQTPTELDPVNTPGVLTGVTSSFNHAAFYLNFSDEDTFPEVDGDSSITWTGSGDIHAGANWYKSVSGTNGAVTSVPVMVPGSLNGTTDVGNPGIVAGGAPSTPGLYFTEIMYDPSGTEPNWEWVELYNSTTSAINLAGYVLDDNNGTTATTTHSASNIASGTVPAGGTAILYNGDLVDVASFEAAWGSGLNLVPVSDWTTSTMSLNNTGDMLGLWSSFAAYDGDEVAHANTVVNLDFRDAEGFPNAGQGQSIYWNDLSSDSTDGSNNWDLSIAGDGIGSYAAAVLSGNVTLHPGGDVGSPGTFIAGTVGTPGDFNGDGSVNGLDFLLWQRDTSIGNLADWQNNYGAGSLAAVSAVPEPAALALLALAIVPVACGRQR